MDAIVLGWWTKSLPSSMSRRRQSTFSQTRGTKVTREGKCCYRCYKLLRNNIMRSALKLITWKQERRSTDRLRFWTSSQSIQLKYNHWRKLFPWTENWSNNNLCQTLQTGQLNMVVDCLTIQLIRFNHWLLNILWAVIFWTRKSKSMIQSILSGSNWTLSLKSESLKTNWNGKVWRKGSKLKNMSILWSTTNQIHSWKK